MEENFPVYKRSGPQSTRLIGKWIATERNKDELITLGNPLVPLVYT